MPEEKEAVLKSLDMNALLNIEEVEPQTPLEKAVSKVTPEDAAASTHEEAKFQFRDLLTEEQRKVLKSNAPKIADKMINDYSEIINFGQPVLQRLNSASTEMLNAQKDIKVPEAEIIVNDLLRNIDGYEKKFTYTHKVDNFFSKVKDMFGSVKYSIEAMVREAKPIVEKLDIAEGKLREMELRLEDNVTRGQELHKMTNETLEDVVAVLAALEEIQEVAIADFREMDAILQASGDSSKQGEVNAVEYKGKKMTVQELRQLHTLYSHGVSEMEKTWFDWRQQFFLGYAQAPSILNIILVSATMQRRCMSFRTMGIPSARSSIAMWQQAALAKEGAEMGEAVSDGTNRLVQGAFKATGEAVGEVAKAAQAPILNEETINAVFTSLKDQCEGLVEADKWGRQVRARNLQVMEQSEKGIKEEFTESRRKLVEHALNGVQESTEGEETPEQDEDVLKSLGVQ